MGVTPHALRLVRSAWSLALGVLAACSGVIDEPGGGDDESWGIDPNTPPRTVCASGGAEFATIGEAIAATPSGGQIEVCPGTYPERLAISGKSLRIRGAGAELTIIDGGGVGTPVTISGGIDLTLEGVTLRGGLTAGRGGGLHCLTSGLRLRDSALIDNRASDGGGGLYGEGCVVELDRVRFDNNEGTTSGGGALLVGSHGEVRASLLVGNRADDGGGITVLDGEVGIMASELRGNLARVHGGAIFTASDAVVQDSLITANQSSWTGGGVYVDRHMPTFLRNIVSDNTAVEEGGGLYLHESQAVLTENQVTGNTATEDGGGIRLFSCNAFVERNLVTGNHAEGDGGGIKSSHVATRFVDNQVTGNTADGAGGGFELDNDASVLLGGVVSGNRASIGGGIHIQFWPWLGGTLDGIAITDNQASLGGGIYAEDNFQPATLSRLTVTGNRADRGGAVFSTGGYLVLGNSQLVGNHAGEEGGALYLMRSEAWVDPCPCPPVDPPTTVDFVVLHGNDADAGAGLWTDAPAVTVSNSILTAQVGTAVTVGFAAPAPQWRYNDTYPASFVGMLPSTADGNQAIEPQFHDPVSGDFRLRATSACIDAGDPAMRDADGSRADMGKFAGPGAP